MSASLGGPRGAPGDGGDANASPQRSASPVAYFWGDDGYGIEAATEAIRRDPGRFPAGVPERWTTRGDAGPAWQVVAAIAERLGTASMFGAGTLVVVGSPGPLLKRGQDRDALISALALTAPGNGIVLVDETGSGRKDPPLRALAEAVRAAGGEVRRFDAPREGALAAWIEGRARERAIALAPGAARELATRIGGFVREGDVDRRNQGRIAVGELEKLALRRLDGAPVTPADVRELVAEAVPGTIWGFVDAVGMRQRQRSLQLLERLLDETPAPVLLAVLHRRLRELIEVADRLTAGESPGSLVRSMKLQPFRAETLARQAHAWTLDELEAALDGLVELDALVKGVGGRSADEAAQRLAFDLWITDRVAPA